MMVVDAMGYARARNIANAASDDGPNGSADQGAGSGAH
jgi:hypothetical protein